MSIDVDVDHTEIGTAVRPPGHVVEVRRRAGLAVGLGAGASLVAVAYLARAASGGGALDWALFAVLGLIGVANLAALLDARTPLLVADDLGVRLRLARTWVGLPWGGLAEVEHRPGRGWWRDGLLVVHTHYVQRVLEDLDPPARRTARLNARLHRTPLSVPLGLGTRVLGGAPARCCGSRGGGARASRGAPPPWSPPPGPWPTAARRSWSRSSSRPSSRW